MVAYQDGFRQRLRPFFFYGHVWSQVGTDSTCLFREDFLRLSRISFLRFAKLLVLMIYDQLDFGLQGNLFALFAHVKQDMSFVISTKYNGIYYDDNIKRNILRFF